MNKTSRTRLNKENGSEVESVGNFLEDLKKLKEKNDDEALTYFFRGQQAEYWNISSSLFRENMLNIEYKLLKDPLTKFPTEFSSIQNTFDLMTKYQHYGLCTRLLDLTTNPLVALYFACLESEKENYEKSSEEMCDDNDEEYDNREPWGIIYLKKEYPIYSDDEAVKIITAMAKYDLITENSINSVLDMLCIDNIITEDRKKILKSKDYEEFINIIQKNYTVIPTYNNLRLTKQNGAFLLPGMFIVEKNIEGNTYNIIKGKQDLREEFEKQFFYIDGDNKENIRKELDLCNINEATLFPELEHQLCYLKKINSKNLSGNPEFMRYENASKMEIPNSFQTNLFIVDEKTTNKKFINEFEKYLKTKNEDSFSQMLISIFQNNQEVDWYKKESIISKIRKEITKLMFSRVNNIEKAKEIAQRIVNEALKLFYSIADIEINKGNDDLTK